jgi:RNA polymerase sigma-70 factor (ECF subfamily)
LLRRRAESGRALGGLDEASPEALAVRAARRGAAGRRAFGALVEMFEERLYNFVLRRCRDREQAADLTQETFLRAWERIEAYDPAWRFSTWLYTIASRQVTSGYRRRKRRGTVAELPEVAAPVANGEGERRSDDRRMGARLWALAAERLSEEQHTALWLRYAEDMTIEEIARVLGKSSVGVRVCLFRARQALAGMCEGAGVASMTVRDPTTPGDVEAKARVRTGTACPVTYGGVP